MSMVSIGWSGWPGWPGWPSPLLAVLPVKVLSMFPLPQPGLAGQTTLTFRATATLVNHGAAVIVRHKNRNLLDDD